MANDPASESWRNIVEAVNYVSKFCEDGHHPVRIDNKTSVATYNRKTKNVAWDREQKAYRIKTANYTHSHDIGPDLFKLYPTVTGRFAPLPVCPLDVSPHGRFASWTFRLLLNTTVAFTASHIWRQTEINSLFTMTTHTQLRSWKKPEGGLSERS